MADTWYALHVTPYHGDNGPEVGHTGLVGEPSVQAQDPREVVANAD
jgi:hypothetical protein